MVDKTYWLDEYGQLGFQNKENPYKFAHRAYHWVDRVIFTDESNWSRTSAGQCKFSELNTDEWTPITKEEYTYIRRGFREVIAIRREIRINKILE
jgi:hypothetical protein